MFGHFSQESLRSFAESHNLDIESQDFSGGLFDFARCQRDNGTVYGTRGACKKGTPITDDQAELLKASNRKRGRGTYGGSLKEKLKRDEKFVRAATEFKKLESETNKAREMAKKATTDLESDLGNAEKRSKYKTAQETLNRAYSKSEEARFEMKKRQKEIQKEHDSLNIGGSKPPLPDLLANKNAQEGKGYFRKPRPESD